MRLVMCLIFLTSPAVSEPATTLTPFTAALSQAALDRTRHHVVYDRQYRVIAYPGGDVPADRGVCTDVVIRSYRAVGIDLQRAVHEDMKANFHLYPARWGLRQPDRNIDHRRVPNLRVFFARHGKTLSISRDPHTYHPGDIVTWNLRAGGDLPHIGIMTEKRAPDGTPLIVHNIGAGPVLEDILFKYQVAGHYRYGAGK